MNRQQQTDEFLRQGQHLAVARRRVDPPRLAELAMQRREAEHVLRASVRALIGQAFVSVAPLRERAAMLDAAEYPHLAAWTGRGALEAKASAP